MGIWSSAVTLLLSLMLSASLHVECFTLAGQQMPGCCMVISVAYVLELLTHCSLRLQVASLCLLESASAPVRAMISTKR